MSDRRSAPFEETLIAVDEARDVGGVVLPEPAPENEQVAPRDDARGIELQPEQAVDRREDAAAIRALSLGAEKLRIDHEPTRRALADLEFAQLRREPGGSRRRDERSPS